MFKRSPATLQPSAHTDSQYAMLTSYVAPPGHPVMPGPQADAAYAMPPVPSHLEKKESIGVGTSLKNGFADFLVQFNNNTVKAMKIRLQKFETALEATMRSIQEEQRLHETRVAEKIEAVHRQYQDAFVESAERVFAEESRGRDVGASKVVMDVLLGLGERLEDVKQQTIGNAATMNTFLKSVDERLSKLETSHTSPLTNIINSSSSVYPSSDSSNHSVLTAISGQVEELGCMLDQLSKRVDGARDEAHQDKEELAQLFDETHNNLTLGLHVELRALKNAVGVGKGCLRGSKSDGPPTSLAERLESLAMDYQETMEYFKDAEATHDDTSYLKLKQDLEELTDFVKSNTKIEKVTRDAAVMTDATDDVIAEEKDTGSADATVQTKPSSSTLSADDFNSSCADQVEGDFFRQPIASFKEVFRLKGIKKRIGSSGPYVQGLRLPRAPRFTPSFGRAPTSDAKLQKDFKKLPSGIQAYLDPRASLNSRSSSVDASGSMSVTLKRKLDAVGIQQGGDAECDATKSRGSHDSNMGEPSSPTFPEVRKSALNPYRSQLLATSATPEDDLDSSDADDHDGDSANYTGSLSGIFPASLSSVPGKKASAISEACEPAPKPKNIIYSSAEPLVTVRPTGAHLSIRYWCPHECGRSYAYRKGLGRHLKKCPGKENNNLPVSMKRRKVAKDEASVQNSAGVKSGTSQKSNGSGGNYVHSREVLGKCTWPPKTMVNKAFGHQLLQCDRCDSYYHYGCVGVMEGDERLKSEGPFICPPCDYVNDPQGPMKKSKVRRCRRSDCHWQREVEEEVCDDDSDLW